MGLLDKEKWCSPLYLEKLHYILNIFCSRITNNTLETKKYFPLNFDILGEVIGRGNVYPAKNILTKAGILERYEHPNRSCDYIPGVCSTKYRLKAPYSEMPFKEVPILDNHLRAKLERNHKRRFEENVATHPHRLWQYDCLQTVTILPTGEPFQPKNPDKVKPKSEDQWKYVYRRISAADFFMDATPDTGRLHHSVGCAASKMRPHMELDGHPIDIIDISAAQLMFLADLYPANHPELQRYIEAFASGEFYELINAASGYPYGNPVKDRGKLKKAVLTNVIYRNKPSMLGADLAQGFMKLFPDLNQLREDHVYNLGTQDGHTSSSDIYRYGNKKLAREMQRVEAEIVTRDCINWIREETELPALTIHDAVMIPKGEGRLIARVLGELIEDRIGIKPIIKNLNKEIVY